MELSGSTALVTGAASGLGAATALALGLPLITRDARIRQLTNISAVW